MIEKIKGKISRKIVRTGAKGYKKPESRCRKKIRPEISPLPIHPSTPYTAPIRVNQMLIIVHLEIGMSKSLVNMTRFIKFYNPKYDEHMVNLAIDLCPTVRVNFYTDESESL